MPLKDTSPIIRRFYNGVSFERCLRVFLFLDGEHLTYEDVRRVSDYLGGQNKKTGQGSRWNSLQNILCRLRILLPKHIGRGNRYEWNDLLVPYEYKQALEMVRSGFSIDQAVEHFTRQI